LIIFLDLYNCHKINLNLTKGALPREAEKNMKLVITNKVAPLPKIQEVKDSVSGADIRAVLYALVDVSIDGLSKGAIIRMGELGYFRISLKSDGKSTPEEVTGACVKRPGIIFTPAARLRDMLKTLRYVKA